MGLPFQVKLVDQKGLGFDKSGLLSKTQFQELKNCGYETALRNCLSGADDKWINDVKSALETGLSVGIYQGYYSPYWADLSEATERANFAINRANMVDYSYHGTIWLDVEGIGSNSHQHIITWINIWSKVVRDAGFGAGVYCGCNTLTGNEYYYDLTYVTHYWENCSPSCKQSLPVRGYEIIQTQCGKYVDNILIDEDQLSADKLGQYPEGMTKV